MVFWCLESMLIAYSREGGSGEASKIAFLELQLQNHKLFRVGSVGTHVSTLYHFADGIVKLSREKRICDSLKVCKMYRSVKGDTRMEDLCARKKSVYAGYLRFLCL